jgi:hypothetical protein
MFENEIDCNLFTEIICTEGAILVHHEEIDGEKIDWYLCNGRKIPICVSDEFLTKTTACSHLRQLDLGRLIETLFI